MKRNKTTNIILSTIVVLVAVLLTASYFTLQTNQGILQGQVVDELSGDVVRQLQLKIDGKSDILFQSKEYRLTDIPPGTHLFEAKAPYYHPFSQEIEIKRGINYFNFSMRGQEIPDLAGIICFSEPVAEGIQIEIRFKNSEGTGISDYPALPLELEGKLYLREGTEDNYSRGELLFEGPIKLFWDPKSYLARNKGIIPWEEIPVDPANERYGIMELILKTPQGNFEDVIEEVELFKKEE